MLFVFFVYFLFRILSLFFFFFFFFNDTATTEIYTLSLHDALPIWQERGLAQRGRGRQAPADDGDQLLGRLDPALAHVHVRICLVPVEQVGAPHHGVREVAVEIEGDGDRHGGTDDGAHGFDEVALAVVQALRHHGAVKVEQDAVHRAGRLEVAEHPLLDVAVDVLRDEAGGGRGGGDRGKQRRPEAGGRLDHAAQARAGAAVRLDDLAAVVEVAGLELSAVGGDIAECVRLVGQHGQEQSHRALLYTGLLWGFL